MLLGIRQTNKKIKTGANFIDYFVHDILDYTILNNSSDKFTKILKVFDIRDSLEEILQMQEDKAIMKQITVGIKYVGFNGNYTVKTDQKRMQQVLLNLFSNSLKFTDRNGHITIMIEKFED